MTAAMIDRKFVFIVGLHRSGTTLLANLLAGHPDVSGFENTGAPMDEGQFLQTVYPVGPVWGGDAIGRIGFDPCAYLTERSSIATRENAEKLLNEWSDYWDMSKPVLLEKSPPNIINVRPAFCLTNETAGIRAASSKGLFLNNS